MANANAVSLVRRWKSIVGLASWLVCATVAGPIAAQAPAPPPPQLQYLEGHSRPVLGVSYSPDGKLLVSSSLDGTLRVWDRATGQLITTIYAGDSPAMQFAVSPDGLSVATGGRDGVVRRFDLPRNYPLVEWPGLPGGVPVVAAPADAKFVLTGDQSGTVRWWDATTKAAARDFPGSPAPISAVALAESLGHALASGGDGGIRGWKFADGQAVGTILAPLANGLAVAPDGAKIAVAGQDGLVRLFRWPPVAHQPIVTHQDQATAVAVTPDGKWIVSGGLDQQVLVFSGEDGKQQRALAGGPGRVTSVAISDDGARAAAGGETGLIKAWQATDGVESGAVGGHAGAITRVAIHPREPLGASAGVDGSVRIWSWPVPQRKLVGHTQPVQRVALRPDGAQAVSTSGDKSLRLWNVADGQLVRAIENLPQPPSGLAVTAKGDLLLAGDATGELRVWSATDGKPVGQRGAHVGPVTAVRAHPQGEGWLTTGADGLLKWWTSTPGDPRPLAAAPAPATALAMTGDGKQLIAAQPDGSLLVYDATTGQVARKLDAVQSSPVTALRLSADQSSIVAADTTGRVAMRNLSDGKVTGWLAGHEGGVTSVAVHPREPLFATSAADGVVRLWRRPSAPRVLVAADAAAPKAAAPKAVAPVAAAPNAANAAPPVAVSHDGQWWAAGLSSGETVILTAGDGKETRRLATTKEPVRALAVRHDSGELAIGDDGGRVTVASVGDGKTLASLQLHDGPISGVAYHPGGQQIASGGADGLVRIAQLNTTASQSLGRHAAAAISVVATSDGARAFSIGAEPSLRAVEVASGQPVYHVDKLPHAPTSLQISADHSTLALTDAAGGVTLRGAADGAYWMRLVAHAGAARAVAFPGRAAAWVSVGDDGAMQVWDPPVAPRVLDGHTAAVQQLVVSPNGQSIASVSTDRTVRTWTVADGSPGWTLAHEAPVLAATWRADGAQLATVDEGKRVRVWNLADGQQLAVLEGFAAAPSTVAFTPDGNLVVGTADGHLRFWSIVEKKELADVPAHGKSVTAVAILPGGMTLVSASTDGAVRTWNLADRAAGANYAIGSPIVALAISADGKWFAAACEDKAVRVVQAMDGKVTATLAGASQSLVAVAITNDGQRVAATARDGGVRQWLAAGELLDHFEVGPGPAQPTGLAYASDGKSLIVAAEDQRIRIVKPLHVRKLAVGQQPLLGVAFAPDAVTAVAASRDKTLPVWNTMTGAAVRTIGGSSDVVQSLVVTPDGTKVIGGAANGNLHVWNFADGALTATGPLPQPVQGLRVSRDGSRLSVALADHSVRVVEVATLRVLERFRAEPLGLADATFGADARTLVVAGRDGQLSRVSVATQAVFPAHVGGVHALAWSPNGQHLITTGADRTTRVYDVAGKVVATMAGGEIPVGRFALRRDGVQVVAAAKDGHLYFWHAGNGQLERKAPIGAEPVDVAYSTDMTRVAVTCADGVVRTFVVADGKLLQAVPADNGAARIAVVPVAADPTGMSAPDHVLLGMNDGRVADLTLPLVRLIPGHVGAVHSLAFTPDGTGLLSGGADKTVRLWNPANGQSLRGFGGSVDVVMAVGISGDGTRVIATGVDKHVRVWNFADAAVIGAWPQPAALRGLSLSADRTRAVVWGDDPVVRVVDCATGREIERWTQAAPVTAAVMGTNRQVAWSSADKSVSALNVACTGFVVADAVKVNAAIWTPDGQHAITTGDDRAVKIWKRDGTPVRSLAGCPFPATSLAITPDGATVAAGGQTGAQQTQVLLWKFADGQPWPTITSPVAVVGVASGAAGQIAVAGVDQHVRLYGVEDSLLREDVSFPAGLADIAWTAQGTTLLLAAGADNSLHVATPAVRAVVKAHQGAATALAWTAEGDGFVTAGADKLIRLWKTGSPLPVQSLAGCPAAVSTAALSGDGRWLAAAAADNNVRIWPVSKSSGELPPEVPVKSQWVVPAAVRSIALNRDGSRATTVSDDQLVRIWDVASGKELQRWAGHTAPPLAVAQPADAPWIVSAAADRTVVRWPVAVLAGAAAHEGGTLDVRFAGDGKSLITSGTDKQVAIWNADTLAGMRRIKDAGAAVKSVAVSRDGAWVVGSDEAKVRIWSSADGKLTATADLPAAVSSVAITSDGRLVIAAAESVVYVLRAVARDGQVMLERLFEGKGHTAPITRLTLSSDDRSLISVGADQTVRKWLVASPSPRDTWLKPGPATLAVAFRPDGQRLAVGSRDGMVRTIDLTTGQLAWETREHQGAVHALAYSADGKLLVSGGEDRSARLWDEAGQSTQKISVGITGRVYSVAVSPDGNQILTAGAAKIWQSFQRSSLLRTRSVEMHNDAIYRLTYNAAGNRIATLDYTGHLCVWDAAGGNLLFHQQLASGPAYHAAYSPDGAEIAVATADPRVLRVTIPAAAR